MRLPAGSLPPPLVLNTSAGISIISQAAPIAQEITGVTAAVAAGVVGFISIANGTGRFLWAWLSDLTVRRSVFLAMFLVQAVGFWLMISVIITLLSAVLPLIARARHQGKRSARRHAGRLRQIQLSISAAKAGIKTQLKAVLKHCATENQESFSRTTTHIFRGRDFGWRSGLPLR